MRDVDVAILGSGFASSLCASILAKSGRSVAIIDRGKHPRFAIGESTTPAADFLLHHLAVRYGLTELIPLARYGSWVRHYPQVRCGCKRGFSYVWHGDGSEYEPTADHRSELMVTANASRDVADTQWYRPDVDMFFLQTAQSYGASVIEDASIESIESDNKGNHLITYAIDGQRESIRSPFVIDGSGPQSLLMNQYGGADLTPLLSTNTSAIYSHFKGGQVTETWLKNHKAAIQDFPYPFDDAAVHHLFHDGWLWQIGFDGNLTSIGFVTLETNYPAHRLSRPAPHDSAHTISGIANQEWQNKLNCYPVLRDLYGDCEIADFPGRIFSMPRIQRLRENAAGENWAALSFTAGFIDPLHSTGIAHTLSTVERICEILISSDVDARKSKLETYSSQVQAEFKHIDRIIATCYSCLHDFELFSAATMVYFAAAIALERHRGLNLETGFLLSRDADFCRIVVETEKATKSLAMRESRPSQSEIASLIRNIEDRLQPYNNVGLFTPTTRNMILHTTAAK